MLECQGSVRELPPPTQGAEWTVQLAAGSQIPFVSDGTQKMWAMELFQSSAEAAGQPGSDAPNLDQSAMVAGPANESKAPRSSLPGVASRGSSVFLFFFQ